MRPGFYGNLTTRSYPNNQIAALRRFNSLERRFASDPTFAAKYERVINEYLELNHVDNTVLP